MWPWSEIKRLRQRIVEMMRDDIHQRALHRVEVKNLRDEADAALKLANGLAEVVEQQAAEIDTMRATISTLRKTGIVVNVQEGKR